MVLSYRPQFLHSASVRSTNSTRARLGGHFHAFALLFVHPDLDSAPLLAGTRNRSILTGTMLMLPDLIIVRIIHELLCYVKLFVVWKIVS